MGWKAYGGIQKNLWFLTTPVKNEKGLTGQAEIHGVSRKILWNGFDFYIKHLDRINRIFKISFDRFPEENGQTLSPAAKESKNIYHFRFATIELAI